MTNKTRAAQFSNEEATSDGKEELEMSEKIKTKIGDVGVGDTIIFTMGPGHKDEAVVTKVDSTYKDLSNRGRVEVVEKSKRILWVYPSQIKEIKNEQNTTLKFASENEALQCLADTTGQFVLIAAIDENKRVEIVQRYTGKPLSELKREFEKIESKIFDDIANGKKPDPEDAAVASVLARMINDKTPKLVNA